MKTLKKWDEITRGTKITLSQSETFETLGSEANNRVTLQAGKYLIGGFYPQIVELLKEPTNERFIIPSIELTKFNEVSNII